MALDKSITKTFKTKKKMAMKQKLFYNHQSYKD